jgi:hypothetical protein
VEAFALNEKQNKQKQKQRHWIPASAGMTSGRAKAPDFR